MAKVVVDAAFTVHSQIGAGFLESVYEEALSIELTDRSVPFVRQPVIDMNYKGRSIGSARLDLLVADLLVVEIKAVEHLAALHSAQILSYLRLTGKPVGLLINFNVPLIKDGIRRFTLGNKSLASWRLGGQSESTTWPMNR